MNVTPLMHPDQAMFARLRDELQPLTESPVNQKSPTYDPSICFAWSMQFSRLVIQEEIYFNNANEAQSKVISAIFSEFIQSMILHGFNINSPISHTETYPLHYAIMKNCRILTGALLANGAKVDQLDTNSQTPLFIASRTNAVVCRRILIENGADEKAAE